MRNWLRNLTMREKHTSKEKILYDTYWYTVRPQIVSLIEVRKNTWDKKRVDAIIDALCNISTEAFLKDPLLQDILKKIRKKD